MNSNQNLELFLMNCFKKKINEISDDEINSLETISLDGIDISGIYEKIDFEFIINMFPNLKKILISNYVFSEDDIKNIGNSNASKYMFYNCDFTNVDNCDIMSRVEELHLERCKFKNYDFLYNDLKNIKILSIINPSNEIEINIENLSCKNVEKMYLESCILLNQEYINGFKSITYLDVINTRIEENFVNKLLECEKLQELCILEKYITDEQQKTLKDKGIAVKFNINDELIEREEI